MHPSENNNGILYLEYHLAGGTRRHVLVLVELGDGSHELGHGGSLMVDEVLQHSSLVRVLRFPRTEHRLPLIVPIQNKIDVPFRFYSKRNHPPTGAILHLEGGAVLDTV